MPRAYDDPAADLHALQGLARMRAYGFEDINPVLVIGRSYEEPADSLHQHYARR
jgi:hypothetical protein